MIRLLSKCPDAASPRMLLISAGLHALLLCAIIIVSYSVATRTAPSKENINRVTLTANPGPPVVERTQNEPVDAPAILPRDELEPQTNTKELPETIRQKIEPATISPVQNQAIPLRKRKPAKSVEKPKKPEPKKSDVAAAKKKEDPKTYLDRKLASIREKVESSKSDASPKRTAGTSGSENGGTVAEEKLSRWLEDVRNRINSRWSVFGDMRQVRRLTVIGVKIEDNGHLLDAAVNQSSGNEVFDQSALRAVFQADPFPAIPPEVQEKIRTAGGLALRFAPGGMQ